MNNKRFSQSRGFTLIEILVALAILALAATLLIGFFNTERAELDKASKTIERAISLAENEAIFRNSFTRLRFDLKSDAELLYPGDPITMNSKQEFTVEYGTTSNLTIDPELFGIEKDDEEAQKEKKKYEQNFSMLPEIEEGKVEIPSQVRLFGIGSTLLKSFITEGQVALYTFPSGEKDTAIIILGTSSELVSIEINAFASEPDRRYYDIRDKTLEEIREIALGLYNEWLKN
ncbi:prepilin-type cleavage/methylation N-terminal domain protein [Bacteriovorax sp. BSW11_IV]|uniref:prepilin-type N-terminal cleavage/methylation domain-containing protein n=1 Tax=Bacteriovorax sp. BSW11_IV TaxID=1353529 RepID=UPI000389DB37|nr:prepilin-type N-terminal cleavage/methylation domain-containing protein [Bacteriovorax sp. BSW11_IV]EQC47856.1 prepilin-type cleavage/methylation N-terminal domain protein [Bacteriovorax sp. BSW11_IV]